jgi:putative membrane protein
MFHDFNAHGWGMGWGWLFSLLVIAAIVWVVVIVFNRSSQAKQSGDKKPMDILKERYARGEIDKEEFEERKNNLA